MVIMDSLKTDKQLLQKLESAAGRMLTSGELHQQRVSFILGSMPNESEVTRAEVEKVLSQIEGTKAA